MPVTPAQLVQGAAYQRESYAQNDPIDQVTSNHETLKWLIANKKDTVFGNGVFNEKVRIGTDSNFQNYTGDNQVTYNKRDTVRKAPFYHYEAHDGFTLNETELANNGIIMTDDRNAVMTGAEKIQIVNILRENHAVLKIGMQDQLALQLLRDGSQSPLAVPGLDLLVSTTPTIGTIGGIAASSTYWQNNANMGIDTTTPGNLVKEMEETWRACTTYGGMVPDFIPAGSEFYDAYRDDSLNTINRQLQAGARGGTSVDASTSGVYFKGVPVVWDPDFDKLDSVLGAITYPWTKRAYFLNSKTINLRPFKGRWMIDRKPSRMYDRYSHYFATTADYGMSINKRNANAVLSIA